MQADDEPAEARSGLERLYDLHRTELLRFLVARTGERSQAEDIVQDMWLRLRHAGQRMGGGPDGGPGAGPIDNGRAYLFRMAQNLVLDRLREERRRQARDRIWSAMRHGDATGDEAPDPAPSADAQIEARQEADRLSGAIAMLPPGARRAFVLHKIQGLSHADVAARLGISVSGVEKHMAVAMKTLRRMLAD